MGKEVFENDHNFSFLKYRIELIYLLSERSNVISDFVPGTSLRYPFPVELIHSELRPGLAICEKSTSRKTLSSSSDTEPLESGE